MKTRRYAIWGALWQSCNKLDGFREHIIYDGGLPALFKSRQKARQFIHEKYGYIKKRPDLRAEPHGWRTPKAVRVIIEAEKF